MANNLFKYINETIFFLLFNENLPQNLSFIKKNLENLNSIGDFSFPIKSKIWYDFTPKDLQSSEDNDTSTDKSETEILLKFLEKSKEWICPLRNANIWKDKCICFLERKLAIHNFLQQILENDTFCKQSKSSLKLIYLEKTDNNNRRDKSISFYRADLVKKVIQNLLVLTEWTLLSDFSKDLENVIKIEFFSVSEEIQLLDSNSNILIRCGIVCDSRNKKIVRLTYSDYHTLRSRDMQLIAMHKYGVRIHDEKNLNELIHKLGTAAVIVDLLEVAHTRPVSTVTTGIGSSKGASFIMYNYARCETILRTFYEKQNSGYYPELPLYEDIDKTVLEEDDEWKIIYNFILYFPDVIRKSIDGIENGKCAPHLICKFLSNFAASFSVYYRKVKILTENRLHLLPTLFARIYLVKSIRKIFLINFKILGIDPVSYM